MLDRFALVVGNRAIRSSGDPCPRPCSPGVMGMNFQVGLFDREWILGQARMSLSRLQPV